MNETYDDADLVAAKPSRERNAQVKWGSGEIGVKPTPRKSKRAPAAFSTAEVNEAVAQFLARKAWTK
ncbi:hypothetical protein DPV79_15980 [Burkholderia reimsis]|uniref:Uncharacterized protein n=1 Tax=Burkholderia reimsis TaxID=2234132 RepID=A0A365QV00_9BURK|nr:hypothetical protein DPV79_15980 [Burkholderia reimsis]